MGTLSPADASFLIGSGRRHVSMPQLGEGDGRQLLYHVGVSIIRQSMGAMCGVITTDQK